MFLLLIPLALWLFYKWSVDNLDYFDKIGIPYEKPLPLVGNYLGFITQTSNIVDMTRKSYNNFKKSKVFGFFNFKQEIIYITDPDLIKQITIKDFDSFVNHNLPAQKADKIFGRGLFSLGDKDWREMRSTLSPMFTSSKMKMMFGLLSDHANDFLSFLEERAKKGENLTLRTKDIFARFTVDGISTSLMGFEADCVRNKESEIFKIANNLLTEFFGVFGSLKIILSFAIPKLYNLLGLQLIGKDSINFFERVVIDMMKERDRKNISRPDMIQLMLQLKKGQLQSDKENEVNDKELANFSANVEYDVGSNVKTTVQFTDNDWISQGLIFFVAGFDTTSSAIEMTTYELAKNPDVQKTLLEEIDSVASTLGGKSISYDVLHKMKFLDMVVSETLRKWPPVVQTDRLALKDYNVDLGNGKKLTIKKDQNVYFPIYHLHHDPDFFPNPEKFDPHRFSDENKDSIMQGSYLPFGLGPRTCIGSRYALMEGKLLLFTLLRKFSIEKCDKTPETITYKADSAANIKESIYLKFVLRK